MLTGYQQEAILIILLLFLSRFRHNYFKGDQVHEGETDEWKKEAVWESYLRRIQIVPKEKEYENVDWNRLAQDTV
jgi:hypothetical protein